MIAREKADKWVIEHMESTVSVLSMAQKRGVNGMRPKFGAKSQPARSRGMTLMELMVVLAVVAILAAVAYPAYQGQARKSRRSEAWSALMDAAQRQERFFTANNQYAASMSGANSLNYVANPACSIPACFRTDRQLYDVGVVAATAACPIASCFVLQALPVVGQAQAGDPCATLAVNSLGQKGLFNAGMPGGVNPNPARPECMP